ncbi:unnamed protein product [Heterobilharzia americana]|nr:unnamed protein product [Heterobilharzia americana]
MRFTHFADDFFELCRYSLVSSEQSLYRERTIDFITKFALFCGKSDENNDQDVMNNRLLWKFFLFCIKYNECLNPAVRFRCAQIIHKLLDGIGDNGVMPEKIYERLQSVLLRRVFDTKVCVRIEAIQGISRMQDPTDTECRVVEALIWLTRHDPSAEVRRTALAAMMLTTRTLPILVERCRDVADSVRRTAYKLLSSRSILRPLSIANRIRILQLGLSDISEDVREAAKELVLSWFNATNRDPVQLLRRLDPEGDPAASQKALDSLFGILTLNELVKIVEDWSANYLNPDMRTLKADCLTSEATFFWRALVEFIDKKEKNACRAKSNLLVLNEDHDDDEESNVLQLLADLVQPSVTAYVDLAKSVVEKLVQTVLAQEFDEKAIELECVVEQILSMASSLDLSDEFGRRRLVSLVREWITSQQVSGTLAPQLLKLYGILEPSSRRCVDNVIEMINELCYSVEPQSAAYVPNELVNSCTTTTTTTTTTSTNTTTTTTSAKIFTDQPALSRKKEIDLRLKIASLEVRMNEINESLYGCVSRKEFERATELRDAFNELDSERTKLLRGLHGRVATFTTEKPSSSTDTDEQVNSESKVFFNNDDNGSGSGFPNSNHVGNDENEGAENTAESLLQRCSSAVLFKANRMACLVVQQSPNLWCLPASLRSLLDSLILPSIQHSDVAVRNQAMLALGLCCSMDLPLALQHIHVFYSAMRVDHLMISETALGCIVDSLLVFGFLPFHDVNINPNARLLPADTSGAADGDGDVEEISTSYHDYVVLTRGLHRGSILSANRSNHSESVLVRCDEMSETAYRLLKPITSILEKEDDGLQSTAALGLAKLLIHNRIVSSHILSLLLLLWFSPSSVDNPQLRRGLASFFSDYVCPNGMGMGAFEHQSALADAVLPTLSTLIRAPACSPLSEVDAYGVASLLARLTDTTHLMGNQSEAKNVSAGAAAERPTHNNGEDGCPSTNEPKPVSSVAPESEKINNPHHDRLVTILANEVLKAPQSAEAKLYLRMLFQLRPSTDNIQIHKELLKLIESMAKFADTTLKLLLHRFHKQLVDKMQRLGVDLSKLNETVKPQNSDGDAGKDELTASSSHYNEYNASDQTLVVDENGDQHQPTHRVTLLGSARVNFHLLSSAEPGIEKNHGNATMKFSQLNKTLAGGTSMLDKSLQQNILAFSDDDCDSHVTPTPFRSTVPPVKNKRKKANSTAYQRKKQKSTNVNSRNVPPTRANHQNLISETYDDDDHHHHDERPSSSVVSHSVPRNHSRTPKNSRQSDTPSSVSSRSTKTSGRLTRSSFRISSRR